MSSSGFLLIPSPPTQAVSDDLLAGAARSDRHALAARLEARATVLARRSFDRIGGWEKFADLRAAAGSDDRFIADHLRIYPTYLSRYFETGDPAYRDLYTTQKRRHLYEFAAWPAERLVEHARSMCEADAADTLAVLGESISPPQAGLLTQVFAEIHRAVHLAAGKRLRVLFVGDCLYLDMLSFAEPIRAEDGIDLDAEYVTTKNPIEMDAMIRSLAGKPFDLVAYSPLTYENSLTFRRLMSPRSATLSSRRVDEIVSQAMGPISRTVDLLADLFECPIVVHNTAGVRRHDRGLVERLRTVVTARPRRLGRERINPLIRQAVDDANARTFGHVFLFDEAALLTTHRDFELGSSYTHTAYQHAAVLGRLIAPCYQDLAATCRSLTSRKLIVCDLDNTLWDGVIGEGRVEHHAARQQSLEALRRKGVVLAINSKNDPANIRWEGALLSADSFVNAQINWDSKVTNMRRIQQDLNLKFKDFVFIDDRPDEREMMKLALPEVHVMDALSPRTWRLIALWAQLLVEEPEMDRTKMYRERAERQKYIEDTTQATSDERDLFKQLDIRLTVRRAAAKDLKRVAELINRTNQFNLNGTRTTLAQVKQWHESPSFRIVLVDAADKFGDNGTVCVAVTEAGASDLRIIAMVLSCRVFGYGIEHSVLNYVTGKIARPGQPIVGLFTATPHNQPCHRFYPDHGFVLEGGAYVLAAPAVGEDPAWLTVQHA